MMKDRYIILILLAIIILQTTLLQLFRIAGVIPDLMLVWVVITAALFDKKTSIKTAIYAGILFDIVSGKGLGVHLAIYLPVALVIATIEDKIFKDNQVTPFILLGLATAFSYIFTAFVYYFSTGRFLLVTRLFSHFLPSLIYNLLVGAIFYLIVMRLRVEEKDR